MIETIMPALLAPVVEARAYWDVSPNTLEKDDNGDYKTFVVMQEIADSKSLYVDQTMATKRFARVQIMAAAPDPISRKLLAEQIENAIVNSGYSVEVYDGANGGYDDSRQLYSHISQFGIWFDRPIS